MQKVKIGRFGKMFWKTLFFFFEQENRFLQISKNLYLDYN